MPEIAQPSLNQYRPLAFSDSGLSFGLPQLRLPVENKEDIQTSQPPISRTLSPIVDDVPSLDVPLPTSSLAVPGLQLSSLQPPQATASDFMEDLTPPNEYHRELELNMKLDDQIVDLLATPRKSSQGHKNTSSSYESADPMRASLNTSLHALASKTQADEPDRPSEPELIACDTCESVDKLFTRTRMSPCGVSISTLQSCN